MIPGLSGSLLSNDALERVIPSALSGRLDEAGRTSAQRRLRAWHLPLRTQLGPAMSARALFDRLAAPLASALGYKTLPIGGAGQTLRALLQSDGRPVAILVVTAWGQGLTPVWRQGVTSGIGYDVRWCLCLSGPSLRVADGRRTYSRRFAQFDLQTALDDPRTFAVFWGLLRADAMLGTSSDRDPLLDRAVALSERHRTDVRSALQEGVHQGLDILAETFAAARRRSRAHRSDATTTTSSRAVDEALIVIYRILFLLFAEARGLVPNWHPVYAESYTIEALRGPVELLPRPRGLWAALQAITRLAHRGCSAGTLTVPPFNGRLFSPAHAPLADTLPLDDAAIRRVLLSLTTRACASGRERIAYGDLGVEQLGGVYERLLDLEPPSGSREGARVTQRSSRRKTTGSFYTPRSLTEYLVRRTLAPLVAGRSPEDVLALRVLDPAMGSGAFLVAACRYLAAAYESALLDEGGLSTGDIDDRDRARFRRVVAQRCLFGVDINPMAVQLGKLSLWLATLAADRPLTFLDHHLRTGNSLVGASPLDLGRQPPPDRGGRLRPAVLPLFEGALDAAVQTAVGVRQAIALDPGDTLQQVRAKEQALSELQDETSMLARWKTACDLWCSGWFREAAGRAALRRAFGPLVDALVTGTSTLSPGISERILLEATTIAARERFFHWMLEFPEVFYDSAGGPLPAPGFDAVIGNPPWEMVRGDHGDADGREMARRAAAQLSDFARGSGTYRLQPDGHPNLYQLFLERALSLTRPGGRLGLVLPSGLATDHGCGPLRTALLNLTELDTFATIENRESVFPIHRGLRFILLTASLGGRTSSVPTRFGLRRPDVLDELPGDGIDPEALAVPRALLERLGGTHLVIPELRSRRDLEIVGAIAFNVPTIEDGWRISFGRELNATDDRRCFSERLEGVPVLEGKHVRPFVADVSAARFRVTPANLERLAARVRRSCQHPRLAYRDVASSTNRRTLIAAMLPAGVLTMHTLFCLKEDLAPEAQLFLCGVFNSFVANYLVRLRVGTHVTASIIARLPVPNPDRDSREFRRIAALSGILRESPDDTVANTQLQASVARLYGLDRAALLHVLDTFPLVPVAEREAVLAAFEQDQSLIANP